MSGQFDVVIHSPALLTYGLTDLYTIDGVGLETFGFIWSSYAIWTPGSLENNHSTIWASGPLETVRNTIWTAGPLEAEHNL